MSVMKTVVKNIVYNYCSIGCLGDVSEISICKASSGFPVFAINITDIIIH